MKKTLLFMVLMVAAAAGFAQAVQSVRTYKDRVTILLKGGVLQIYPLTQNAVRVRYAEQEKAAGPELVFTEAVAVPRFKCVERKDAVEIGLAKMTVTVDKRSGRLTYKDTRGREMVREGAGTRMLRKSAVQGEPCYVAQQGFEAAGDEFLYGTGQFQDGYLNIKGLSRRLTQVNTQISIPFIISNKGYGVLWHNYGLTEYNPCDQKIELKAAGVEQNGETVNVTSTEGTKKETRRGGEFEGTVQVDADGRYALLLDVGQTMARSWVLSIDGKKIIDFKNYWLPPTTSSIVTLTKGTHRVTVNGNEHDKPVVMYRKVTGATVFRSPVADGVDYVMFAGNADEIIDAYRTLSGKAPMMPLWSLGYIHCRERFTSQEQLLSNAKEFRTRHLPMDLIVQDWQYWGKYGWNAMKFDETNYPDPAGMVDSLHQMGARLMVSVWSRVDPKSDVGKEFAAKGYYIPNTQWIDFLNPKAADFYWEKFSQNLLKPYHIDAWWQDATEPENDDLAGRKINNQTTAGERYRNVYPLFVTRTVYEGSRRDAPGKRVFILTRSAFSGEQRYASAVWTGDVGNDWETMRRQLTAGLNYTVTGMPWWTFDAGGFFRPGGGQYTDAAYRERLLRWFQMATFCPLQRIHGYQSDTEFWRYGTEVEQEAAKYLNLRYRLMPYIYTQAAEITLKSGTLMRPLVMDFANDNEALTQKYEYMFGPAFLVAPVLEGGVKSWDVYLPKSKAGWYNFWTGERFDGGRSVRTEAPLSTIPLYVRAGSIVPMGAAAECTEQLHRDTLEIRIYRGADGTFELYEDEGNNYNYEQGRYAIIPFHWNESGKTLTIESRKGAFDGMLKERYFHIVGVGTSEGKGMETAKGGQIIKYTGEKIAILLDR